MTENTTCFCVIMKIYGSLNSGLAHLIILHNTGLLVAVFDLSFCPPKAMFSIPS